LRFEGPRVDGAGGGGVKPSPSRSGWGSDWVCREPVLGWWSVSAARLRVDLLPFRFSNTSRLTWLRKLIIWNREGYVLKEEGHVTGTI